MRIRHSGTKIFQISTKDFSKQLYPSSNEVELYSLYIRFIFDYSVLHFQSFLNFPYPENRFCS